MNLLPTHPAVELPLLPRRYDKDAESRGGRLVNCAAGAVRRTLKESQLGIELGDGLGHDGRGKVRNPQITDGHFADAIDAGEVKVNLAASAWAIHAHANKVVEVYAIIFGKCSKPVIPIKPILALFLLSRTSRGDDRDEVAFPHESTCSYARQGFKVP